MALSKILAGEAVFKLQLQDLISSKLGMVERRISGIGSRIQRSGRGITSFGGSLATLGTRATVASGAIGGVFAETTRASSKATETLNRFNAIWGDLSGEADSFAKTLSKEIGRGVTDIRDELGTFGSLTIGLDFDRKTALEMSKEITMLSRDFASFQNISDEASRIKFLSGLSGEIEPLKRYGILLSAASTEQKLLELGLASSNAEATEQQKVIARLAIIRDVLGSQGAIGDAQKTIGSFENQLKVFGATVNRLRETVGKSAEKAFLPLIQGFGEAANKIAEFTSKNQELATNIVRGVVAFGVVGAGLIGLGASIAAFGFAISGIGSAVGLVSGAFGALASVVGMLATPMGLATLAIAGVGAALLKLGDAPKRIGDLFRGLGADVMAAIGRIRDAFELGGLDAAIKQVGDSINDTWSDITGALETNWLSFTLRLEKIWAAAWVRIEQTMLSGVANIGGVLKRFGLTEVGTTLQESARDQLQSTIDKFSANQSKAEKRIKEIAKERDDRDIRRAARDLARSEALAARRASVVDDDVRANQDGNARGGNQKRNQKELGAFGSSSALTSFNARAFLPVKSEIATTAEKQIDAVKEGADRVVDAVNRLANKRPKESVDREEMQQGKKLMPNAGRPDESTSTSSMLNDRFWRRNRFLYPDRDTDFDKERFARRNRTMNPDDAPSPFDLDRFWRRNRFLNPDYPTRKMLETPIEIKMPEPKQLDTQAIASSVNEGISGIFGEIPMDGAKEETMQEAVDLLDKISRNKRVFGK